MEMRTHERGGNSKLHVEDDNSLATMGLHPCLEEDDMNVTRRRYAVSFSVFFRFPTATPLQIFNQIRSTNHHIDYHCRPHHPLLQSRPSAFCNSFRKSFETNLKLWLEPRLEQYVIHSFFDHRINFLSFLQSSIMTLTLTLELFLSFSIHQTYRRLRNLLPQRTI